MKINFINSPACASGAHCRACRMVDGEGPTFRAGVGITADAPCPNNRPWGYQGSAPVCDNCGGPHPSASCPIPADTSPEAERRRAAQGGCCGKPSVAGEQS